LKAFTILTPNSTFSRILLTIAFFVLSAAFVPAVGSIFLVLLPTILFFYGTTAGKLKTFIAFLIPFLLLFLLSNLFHLHTPYPVILAMGLVGMTIATIAQKRGSIELTVILPAIIIISAISAYFLISSYELNVNVWQLIKKFVSETIEENIKLYSQLPFDKEDINFIKDNSSAISGFFINIFPAITAVISIVVVWLNILLGKDILKKAGFLLPQLEGISRWKAPDFIIWLFIASGASLFVPMEQVNFIGVNVLIVICFIYMMQGFAIISFLFQNKNVPIFFRYLFYFLIAVQQFLVIPVAAAGLFDIWVDFRKYFQRDQTSA
jgi:uncharacterized protein YybS (DUF2232 family)